MLLGPVVSLVIVTLLIIVKVMYYQMDHLVGKTTHNLVIIGMKML